LNTANVWFSNVVQNHNPISLKSLKALKFDHAQIALFV